MRYTYDSVEEYFDMSWENLPDENSKVKAFLSGDKSAIDRINDTYLSNREELPGFSSIPTPEEIDRST